ncbi:hypothetical protein DD595_25935, partial [Enterobacter cloacae complex sp. 4DZ3-17B2]
HVEFIRMFCKKIPRKINIFTLNKYKILFMPIDGAQIQKNNRTRVRSSIYVTADYYKHNYAIHF